MICPNCQTGENLDVSHIDTISWDEDSKMYVCTDVSCDKCDWEEYYEFVEYQIAK